MIGRHRAPASAERAVVALLVLYALAARLFVAWSLPLWQGPDEPKHFEFARLLVDKRAELVREHRLLRQIGDQSPALQAVVIDSLYRNGYWFFTNHPLPATRPTAFEQIWGISANELGRTLEPYPYFGALVLLPFESRDVDLQLRVVRTLSALLSTGAVFVSYLAARELAPGDGFVRIVATALVAALPMHIFIGGVVNADDFATLLGTLVLFGLWRGLRRGFGGRLVALVGAGLLVAVLAKRTGFSLYAAASLAAVGTVRGRPGRRTLILGTGILGAAAALGLAVLLGPPPFDRVGATLNHYFLNEPDQITRLFDGRLTDPRVLTLTALYLELLHASFWGIFGWFSVRMPEPYYQVLAAAAGLAVLGLVVRGAAYLWRARHGGADLCRRRVAAALLGPALVVVLVALALLERISYFQPGGVPQGRYLFIGVAAFATSFALGWRAFVPRVIVGTWAPTALFVCLVLALDVLALIETFAPYYLARLTA